MRELSASLKAISTSSQFPVRQRPGAAWPTGAGMINAMSRLLVRSGFIRVGVHLLRAFRRDSTYMGCLSSVVAANILFTRSRHTLSGGIAKAGAAFMAWQPLLGPRSAVKPQSPQGPRPSSSACRSVLSCQIHHRRVGANRFDITGFSWWAL